MSLITIKVIACDVCGREHNDRGIDFSTPDGVRHYCQFCVEDADNIFGSLESLEKFPALSEIINVIHDVDSWNSVDPTRRVIK